VTPVLVVKLTCSVSETPLRSSVRGRKWKKEEKEIAAVAASQSNGVRWHFGPFVPPADALQPLVLKVLFSVHDVLPRVTYIWIACPCEKMTGKEGDITE
jgi:hypothetical protein